jgi:spore maturation protein B
MHLTYFIIPLFLTLILILGIKKNSYNSFILGCKKGIEISLDIFPYLLASVFATKLLEFSMILIYLFKNFDLPYLLIVEGLFRPLSNNASITILIDIFNIYGVDSKEGIVGSILQGATETSFYVVTVYYGAIGVKKYSYSLLMAILSDLLIFIFVILIYYFVV